MLKDQQRNYSECEVITVSVRSENASQGRDWSCLEVLGS